MATSPYEPPVSKLRPPDARAGVVERHRLLDQLDRGSSTASLTLLVGYAGSGKTVLLSSWVAMRPATRFAWLSCDTGDADPLRFWTALIAAIRRSEPSFGGDTLDRIELEGAVGVDAIGVLSDELRAVTEPVVIVAVAPARSICRVAAPRSSRGARKSERAAPPAAPLARGGPSRGDPQCATGLRRRRGRGDARRTRCCGRP